MPRNLKNRGFLGSWAVGSDTFCSIFLRTVQNRNSRPTWFLSHAGSFDFSLCFVNHHWVRCPHLAWKCVTRRTDKAVSFHYRAVTNQSNPNEPTVLCVTHAALRLGELSGTTASSTAVPQPMPELVFLNIKLDGSETYRDG